MSDYIPIDCNFYDELVLLSMRKTRVVFVPNKFEVQEDDFIVDLVTEPSKEEFMVMKSGIRIRLDEITGASDNVIFLNAGEEFFGEEE
ncbi:MAG: transcriptional antiterminator Rof (Rho-off) [Saprospiraceae bacterium]|jgi:transcriptional antiterminator Rof (Rho-off)